MQGGGGAVAQKGLLHVRLSTFHVYSSPRAYVHIYSGRLGC